jgi:hypothetical protein
MPLERTYDSGKILAASERDGWVLGYVGIPWPGPWPKRNGDMFVADPEGWQAGIAWETSGPKIVTILEASGDRWGVFQVLFPLPVMSEEDLIQNFHLVLPLLKEMRGKVAITNTR